MLGPTNPWMGAWMPPALQVLVDGPTESYNLDCEGVMGPFYHRLNPGVLGPPNLSPNTTTALFLSGNVYTNRWLQNLMKQAFQKQETNNAIGKAHEFLGSDYWLLGEAHNPEWIDTVYGS